MASYSSYIRWEKTVHLHIDGKLVSEGPLKGKMVTNDNYLGLGFREGSGHYWKGMLDDMALFNRALSGDEVEEIMNTGLDAIVAVKPKVRLTVMWGRSNHVDKIKQNFLGFSKMPVSFCYADRRFCVIPYCSMLTKRKIRCCGVGH